MKKYVVLSVNENPEYLFYLPLTTWAWRHFGWEPIVFVPDVWTKQMQYVINNFPSNFHTWNDAYIRNPYSSYKTETIAQVSRLYAAQVAEGLLMTSDIDMIPLSDYWKPKEDEITCYGRDLTDYHFPICYISMPSVYWFVVMNAKGINHNESIKKGLRQQENMWCLDQDLITENLLKTTIPITRVDRGLLPNGYPVGRVDRSAWSLDHPQLIDCHLPRGMWRLDDTGVGNFAKVMRLLYTVWPNEDFTWFKNYVEEFRKLVP